MLSLFYVQSLQTTKEGSSLDNEIEQNFSDLHVLWESFKNNQISIGNLIKTLASNVNKKREAGYLNIEKHQICAFICQQMERRNFPVEFATRTIQRHIQEEFKKAHRKKSDTTNDGTNINVANIIFQEHKSNLNDIEKMDLNSLTKDQNQNLYEKITRIKKKIEEMADQNKIALFNRVNDDVGLGSSGGGRRDYFDYDEVIPIAEQIPNMVSREIDLWIKDLENFSKVIKQLRLSYREEREYVKGIKSIRLFLTSFYNDKYIRSMEEWCNTLVLTETTTISGAAKLSKVEGKVYDSESNQYVPIGKSHSIGHDQLRKYILKPDYRKFQEIMDGLPFYANLMKLHREHITPIKVGKEIYRIQENNTKQNTRR